MNIYFVDRDLRQLMDNAFDPDTGELLMEEEEFTREYNKLMAKKENILEETALLVKEDSAMIDAIKAEIESLNKRLAFHEKRKARNENFVMEFSGCENFETPRIAVKFRPSERVIIDNADGFVKWAIANGKTDLVTHTEKITDTPNRVAIKKWLKGGATSEFAELRGFMNMSTY